MKLLNYIKGLFKQSTKDYEFLNPVLIHTDSVKRTYPDVSIVYEGSLKYARLTPPYLILNVNGEDKVGVLTEEDLTELVNLMQLKKEGKTKSTLVLKLLKAI